MSSATNSSGQTLVINATCAIAKTEGMAAFVVNIFAAFLASLGNILICATVYSSTRLHKSWCYFVCSLSVADLLVNLIVQPMEAVFTFERMNGACYVFLRDAFRLAAYITCGASLMNLALMSVERCLVIAWPLKQHQFHIMTRRKLLSMLITVWGVPALLGIAGQAAHKGTRLSSILILIGLVGCYGVILTSYAILLLKTRNHFKVSSATLSMRQVGEQEDSRSDRRCLRNNKKRESEKRVARTVAVVIILFTLSWMPYGFVLVSDPEQNINSFYVWAVTVGLTNSAVNPVVYFFSSKDFRDSSTRICRSLICC